MGAGSDRSGKRQGAIFLDRHALSAVEAHRSLTKMAGTPVLEHVPPVSERRRLPLIEQMSNTEERLT